jgi:hypothetical protein
MTLIVRQQSIFRLLLLTFKGPGGTQKSSVINRDMDVFFDTEKAHAVMYANSTDEGGRAAAEVWSSSPEMAGSGGGRSPRISGKQQAQRLERCSLEAYLILLKMKIVFPNYDNTAIDLLFQFHHRISLFLF